MVTLLDKIINILHNNYLGIGDVRTFAHPVKGRSGSYVEMANPLPRLLDSHERFDVVFVRAFNSVDWTRDGVESDLMAIGAVTDWVVWAKDSVRCGHCGQIVPRKTGIA